MRVFGKQEHIKKIKTLFLLQHYHTFKKAFGYFKHGLPSS